MKLHCPHCGVKGSADDSYSGKKVKCPECEELFVVSSEMAIDPPEVAEEAIEQEEISTETVEESADQQEVAEEVDLTETDETESVEDAEEDVAELEDEVEQEPYGIEKKQCWQCGKEEEDESFITNNGRLYCSNCIQPEDPDVDSTPEEEVVESVDESEAQDVPEVQQEAPVIEDEVKPVKKGAWAKLKGLFS